MNYIILLWNVFNSMFLDNIYLKIKDRRGRARALKRDLCFMFSPENTLSRISGSIKSCTALFLIYSTMAICIICSSH